MPTKLGNEPSSTKLAEDRATEFTKGTDLQKAFGKLSQLFHTPPPALPMVSWHSASKILLLRMLARAAGALEFHLRSQCKHCPYIVFGLLDDGLREETAEELLCMKPCLLDSFTEHFVRLHPSVEAMSSATALSMLHGMAMMSQLDVSGIECRHASVRALMDQRQRTWSPLLSLVSADLVCRQVAVDFRDELCQATDLAAMGRTARRRRRENPKKKRGGGGAQRAFFSGKLRGQAVWSMPKARKRALFRQWSAEYHRLSPVELERLRNIGDAARISHRAGGKSFPGSVISDIGELRICGVALHLDFYSFYSKTIKH